jgi:hypothetical protein
MHVPLVLGLQDCPRPLLTLGVFEALAQDVGSDVGLQAIELQPVADLRQPGGLVRRLTGVGGLPGLQAGLRFP